MKARKEIVEEIPMTLVTYRYHQEIYLAFLIGRELYNVKEIDQRLTNNAGFLLDHFEHYYVLFKIAYIRLLINTKRYMYHKLPVEKARDIKLIHSDDSDE